MTVITASSAEIRALLQNASIEMTCKDTGDLAEAATLVPRGTDIFIALFPNQTWDDLTAAAKAVGEAGFNAVPHVPARRIKDHAEVAEIARKLTQVAGAKKMLLIAGDMPSPEGAFDSTIGVLETGELAKAGIKTFYMAGHPEGHAHMTADQQRQFEARKVALSKEQGFELKFTTQVCFESEPIIAWEKIMRASGITNTIRPGLGGPASIKTLLRYAKICGAGASIRALTSGKASLVASLLRDSGPEEVVTQLSAARSSGQSNFESVHMFAFGGFLKTTKWVSAVQAGRFAVNDKDGDFDVKL
jgi:methylenetetrahydrofolate reductase (NADPH)